MTWPWPSLRDFLVRGEIQSKWHLEKRLRCDSDLNDVVILFGMMEEDFPRVTWSAASWPMRPHWYRRWWMQHLCLYWKRLNDAIDQLTSAVWKWRTARSDRREIRAIVGCTKWWKHEYDDYRYCIKAMKSIIRMGFMWNDQYLENRARMALFNSNDNEAINLQNLPRLLEYI